MADPGHEDGHDGDTVAWRALLAESIERLRADARIERPDLEARWIVEEATGLEGADLLVGLDEPATVRGVAHLDALVGRRLAGEPIQYVLGHWPFRSLDLLVDRRVLIPRPETEVVVDVALAALDEVVAERRPGHDARVADLGTGSGAIALAIATERPGTHVWATDRSPEALAVARANLAALGMAAGRVRLAEGSWYEALDALEEGCGPLDLLVANPPYVTEAEAAELDPSVRDWEPMGALVPGPRGLEAYEVILEGAVTRLAPGGAVVLEIGASQAAAVAELAASAGLEVVRTVGDLAGLDRAIVARSPLEPPPHR